MQSKLALTGRSLLFGGLLVVVAPTTPAHHGASTSLHLLCYLLLLPNFLLPHTPSRPNSAWRPHGLAFKAIPPQPLPPAGFYFFVNSNK